MEDIIMTRFTMVSIVFIVVSLMFVGQSYTAVTIDNAVAIWLFDKGPGDVALDSSENGNDGTLKNDPTWVDGEFGKALSFDGQDDSVEVPDSESLNAVDDITIVAWVYLNRAVTSGSWNALVGKNPYGSGYLMWIEVPQEPCGLVFVGGGRSDNRSGVQIDLKKWYHLAFTRIHNGEMKFFIDGNLVNVANSATGVISTLAAPISIGGQSPQVLDGIIDDVGIFNVALTVNEINDIMSKGLAGMAAVSPSGKLTTRWGLLKQ